MNENADDWKDNAMVAYRTAFSALQTRWGNPATDVGRYCAEELKEVLLDLKQALIDDDQVRAMAAMAEINVLWAELEEEER